MSVFGHKMKALFRGQRQTLDAEHPILGRFRKRGLIVNFDEREALESAKGGDLPRRGEPDGELMTAEEFFGE